MLFVRVITVAVGEIYIGWVKRFICFHNKEDVEMLVAACRRRFH